MKKYYTTDEVLKILNISKSTFNRMRQEGKFFEPVRIGRSNKWSVDSMKDYEFVQSYGNLPQSLRTADSEFMAALRRLGFAE